MYPEISPGEQDFSLNKQIHLLPNGDFYGLLIFRILLIHRR
jgi:hypothetical protein